MDTIAPPTSRTLDSKPIAPSLFAHFVLRSSNMQAMVDWYSTVLAMRVVHRNDFICFLTYDEEHHRLAIVDIAGLHAPDAQAWGLAHVAYTFREVGELLSTYRRLKAKGIEPYRPIHHGPTLSMYYRDPDGNSVELQVDCYKTKQEASAYFSTDAFRRNPIGVAFDPEALAQAYEAGVSEAELLRQPDGPAAPLQGRR
ncbi:MAG: biphenyl 2,3-dioxygenase [Alphaproteobacteria bacterium]|nr:biphenyl 2,3-dioxygenase [Alphaproteobacteria bacterium]